MDLFTVRSRYRRCGEWTIWTAVAPEVVFTVRRDSDIRPGTPLHVVSEILGHASITITKDVYGHLVEGDRRAVAASMSRLFGPESATVAPKMAPSDTNQKASPPSG